MRLFPTSVIRPVAVLLVLFYVTASGRALLPGLCATQSAMAERGPEVCEVSKAGCCARRTAPSEGEAPAPVSDQPRCAFCYLTKAVTVAPDLAAPLPVVDCPNAAAPVLQGRRVAARFDPIQAGRAPPFPLPA